MIRNMNHYRHWGLNALSKGLARVLPRSASQKQSGSSWAHLAVFSAFATLSLLFTPNATLAQEDEGPANLTVAFGESSYTAIENGARAMVMISLDQKADRTVEIPITTSPATGPFSIAFTHVVFDVGEQHRTIAVTANDDKDLTSQTVRLSLGTRPSGVSLGSPSSTTVTLWDDDLRDLNISFGAASYTATENGSNATVAITLDSATDRALRIPILTHNDTGGPNNPSPAAATDEYKLSATEVVFNAGQSRKTITVSAEDDDDVANSFVALGFGTLPSGVSPTTETDGVTTTTVSLQDDGLRILEFNKDKYNAVEDGSAAMVTVNLEPAPGSDTDIRISVSPAPASNDPDFSHTISNNTVTVNGGSTTATFTVNALEDDDSSDETITFRIVSPYPPSSRLGKNTSTVVTLQDNEAPPAPTVSFDEVPNRTVAEGSSVQVAVSLNPTSDEEVKVDIRPTISGADSNDDDYKLNDAAPRTTTLTFAAGEGRKTVTIAAQADDDTTPETVTLTLQNLVTVDNAVVLGSPTTTTVTLTDDQKLTATIAAGADFIDEGTSGNTVNVTVTLSEAAPANGVVIPITVDIPPSSRDFTLPDAGFSGSVTVASGQNTASFSVTSKEDDGNTTDQKVTFGFGGLPGNVKAGKPKTAAVTVRDTTRPLLSFGAAAYTAIENGAAATVEITLSPASDQVVTVPINTAAASGAEDTDWLLSAKEVVFAKGEQRKTITVTAAADDDVDPEAVTLTFPNYTPVDPVVTTTGGQASTTVTLADDGQRVVTFDGNVNIPEGAMRDVTVRMDPAPTADVTIPITVSPASGDNFAITVPNNFKNEVTIGTGGSAIITVEAKADDDSENNKVTFSFGALPVSIRAGQPSTATVTLLEPGATTVPTLSFGAAAYTAIENGDVATVPITLEPMSDEKVTVNVTVTDGGDTAAYSTSLPNNNNVVFEAGEGRKTITVTATPDTDTDTEVITLNLGTITSDDSTITTTGGQASTTVTLADDGQAKGTVTFSAPTPVEEGTPVEVTVTLSAAPGTGNTLTIPITTKPATGDFILSPPRRVVFGESDTTQTITVTTTDDMVIEETDMTVELGFGALPSNFIAGDPGGTAKVTFTDGDRADLQVAFGAATYSVDEGKTVKVKVNLTGNLDAQSVEQGADRTVTIPITVDDSTPPAAGSGTADADDYSLSAMQVVFNKGDKSKDITFTANENVDAQADETVILGFAAANKLPAGVTAGGNTETTVTITDEHVALAVDFVDGTTYGAIEGGTNAMIKVVVSPAADRALMIPINTNLKTGFTLEGVTGASNKYMLALAKKATSALITVMASPDANIEDELLTLSFGVAKDGLPEGVTTGGTTPMVNVTLVDNKQTMSTVSFGAAEYTAMEDGDPATVMIKLDPPLPSGSRQTVTIPISGWPMAGAETGDFMLSATEVMFAAGETDKTITVTAVDNQVAMTNNSTVRLIFEELPDGVTAGEMAETMVTLVDDDRNDLSVVFFADTYTATEGGDAATVVVTLDKRADRAVRIPITIDPADGPFTVSPTEVFFAEGDTTQNITVTATLDADLVDGMVTLSFGENLPLGVTAGDQATTVVTLEDDMLKTLTVSFEMATYEAIEEGDPVMVTVMLNEATDRDLTIPITTDPDMGPFTLSSMEVMFIEGEISKMIEVTATDDMDEDNDMVTLMFGELPARVNAGDQDTTEVTLVDDMRAALMVSFEITSYTATEGGDDASVIVSLNKASDRDITVPIIANPAEGDFILSHTEVMFAADDISVTITVTATDDDDVEDDMLELSIGALPADVSKGAQSTTMVTLMDDGLAALVVSFEMASYTAMEAGADAMVKVMLNVASDRDVTVPIIANPAEGDFDLDVTEVVFAEGDQEMLITVTALVDDDVEDEMLELSLGELPLKVTAGDQATTMVTLEDKGFTVVFAQARYSIKESDRGTVTANISPSAIGQIEVPLSVAHQGGATANDYSGVPGSLVFVGGSNQATFTVSVMADEENDPGESIDVSFGNLPDKVNAGDLAMTTVEFEQFRTAEQFSRTLQAALAVVAGSMGDSAISAIETRFERYRESMGSGGSSALRNSEPTYGHWSDMESPGLAISGYQGAGGMDDGFAPMATPGAGLTTGFSRGYRNLTSGSLSDNISLGALASTARPGESAIASGYGGVSGANREQDVSFSGVAFEMAMEHGDEGKFSPVVWVQGDMQSFDGNLENIGMDFDGGLNALHLGVDLYANGQTLAGVSMMQSWGDLDYTDDGVDGNFDSSMSTFHPYIYFQANENLGVWGILGFGSGSVDMSEPDRTHEFDADFSMFAGGVRSVLNRRDNNELGLSADAFTAELSTNAADDIPGVKGEAQRARVMVDWLQNKTMEEGQQLAWKAEIGGRFDGGDGIEGVGIEGGFRVGLLDNNSGLDLALTGRALLLHENDFSDWGIGVQATWDPGEKREGLVASVASSFGQDRGGSTSLWDNGDTIMRPVGMDAMWMDSQYRMDGEVGYAGIRTPLGLPGTVMPYSRARWSGYGQEFGVGTRWMPAASENNLLPATFELEGLSRETRTGLTDLAVLLRMSIPFGGSKAIVPSRNHVSARQVSAATGPTIQPVSSSRQDANSTSESTKAE